MRIGLQTWGSYGDVRPFLAIAGGLAAAGHDVTLYVTCIDDSDFTQTAQILGVKLNMVSAIEMKTREDLVDIAKKIILHHNPVTQLRGIMSEFFEPYADDMYQAALSLCETNDLVLGHVLHHPVQTAALKTNTPYVSVMLFHGMAPTLWCPPVGLPNLGKVSNRFFWGLIHFLMNLLVKPYINRFRLKHGFAAIQDCFDDVWLSKQLTLIGVSNVFCKQQPDWRDKIKVCGFFDTPQLLNEGDIPQDLQQFIHNGEPPIFMGFGSMMTPALEVQLETIQTFVEAAKAVGCRAIIQASLWRECGMICNDQIHFVGECPHAQIFPQCQAVVHHGGSGTTQATTKAGVPSIIVIHLADQLGWALEAKRVGIAPKPLYRHKLTSERLANRIRSVLSSSSMQVRAQQVGERVRKEDGVAAVVTALEARYGR